MHLMLDLETWSIRPNAAIAEIAIVPFELAPRGRVYVEHTFHKYVLAQDGIGAIDNGTLTWWLSQGSKARNRLAKGLSEEGILCADMLTELVLWPSTIKGLGGWDNIEGIWSHGAAFDIPVLENAFNAHGIPKPWAYDLAFCTRTVNLMTQSKPVSPPDPTLMKHYAPDDCVAQIINLQQRLE